MVFPLCTFAPKNVGAHGSGEPQQAAERSRWHVSVTPRAPLSRWYPEFCPLRITRPRIPEAPNTTLNQGPGERSVNPKTQAGLWLVFGEPTSPLLPHFTKHFYFKTKKKKHGAGHFRGPVITHHESTYKLREISCAKIFSIKKTNPRASLCTRIRD